MRRTQSQTINASITFDKPVDAHTIPFSRPAGSGINETLEHHTAMRVASNFDAPRLVLLAYLAGLMSCRVISKLHVQTALSTLHRYSKGGGPTIL